MTKPQTLEEAWRNHGLALTSEELDKAARALALASHVAECYTCQHGRRHQDACPGANRIKALGS